MTAPAAPRLLWGLLCDHFMIDGSGKQSLIGIFDRLTAASFPALHKVMYVVCGLVGEPLATGTAIVTIWTPDDRILLSTPESPLRFSPEGRTSLVHLLYDVSFPQPGDYSIALEINGRAIGQIALGLRQAQPAS